MTNPNKLVKRANTELSILLFLLTYFFLFEAIADVKAASPDHCFGLNRVAVEREYIEPALAHNLCPQLFKAILGAESNWNHKAVNPVTMDFGIGQINYKTAESLHIDLRRLRADRAYSIAQAARVLAHHKKLYKHKPGASWVCSYNQGGKAIANSGLCKAYLAKIQQFNY